MSDPELADLSFLRKRDSAQSMDVGDCENDQTEGGEGDMAIHFVGLNTTSVSGTTSKTTTTTATTTSIDADLGQAITAVREEAVVDAANALRKFSPGMPRVHLTLVGEERAKREEERGESRGSEIKGRKGPGKAKRTAKKRPSNHRLSHMGGTAGNLVYLNEVCTGCNKEGDDDGDGDNNNLITRSMTSAPVISESSNSSFVRS